MPLREFPAPKEAAERIAVAHARAVDVAELEIPIDGSVDVTRQLQAAWREYGLIKLPAGTYEVSAMLEGPPLQGAGIIGSGSGSTLIVTSNLTDDVIRSSDKVFAPIFSGLAISRSALATTGYGLNMNPTSTNDWALVRDLWLWNHAIGINLGSTGYSVAQQIRSEANRFHGFTIVGQWQLFDLVALVNGGNGVSRAGAAPGFARPVARFGQLRQRRVRITGAGHLERDPHGSAARVGFILRWRCSRRDLSRHLRDGGAHLYQCLLRIAGRWAARHYDHRE
jgi:hypothetical protein